MSEKNSDLLATLVSAMAAGDHWMNADACALFLGLVTPDGQPNRRGFLESVACRPSFPEPLMIGARKAWKKSEVARWAEDERRIVNRAA